MQKNNDSNHIRLCKHKKFKVYANNFSQFNFEFELILYLEIRRKVNNHVICVEENSNIQKYC